MIALTGAVIVALFVAAVLGLMAFDAYASRDEGGSAGFPTPALPWQMLQVSSGADEELTAPVRVPGPRYRIHWQVTDDTTCLHEGVRMGLSIASSANGQLVPTLSTKERQHEGMSYVYYGPGTYFLGLTPCGDYELTIEAPA